MSEVLGVLLDDGREVVVKARPSGGGRANACVEVQKRAAEAGLPCAAPLTSGIERDGHTIHAEEWRPGGSMRREDGPEHAAQAGTDPCCRGASHRLSGLAPTPGNA